jgi:hypothetical protein
MGSAARTPGSRFHATPSDDMKAVPTSPITMNSPPK